MRQVTAKDMSEESFYLGAVSNKNETEEAKWTVSLKIGDILYLIDIRLLNKLLSYLLPIITYY